MTKTETETIEYKKSLAELKEGLISIVAILNKHKHGELWFGIRNDGKAVGIEANEKTLRDISQSIAAHIEPRIYPTVEIANRDGAACIKVTFKGKEAPYFAYGRAYMRVADEDRQISAKELENLILAKNRDLLHWDSETSTAGFDDLDDAKLKRFVERGGLTWDSPANALEKLGVIKEGRLLNAAQLFFSRTAPMQLRCAVFATTDSATIIDRHDFDGDILELIEEAQKYILKNIHIGMRLKGLYREDVPEISSEAMREAIINAFCHRDYRDPDYVQIAVFKNRVEIRSPGGLYDDMTIEKMLHGNVSKRRNPLIANLLRRIQMVEAWGRGMPLILKNAPNVSFREISNIFIASFERPSFLEEEETGGTTEENTKEKPKKRQRTIKETIKEKPKTTKETILDAIIKKPSISVKDLAELCGLSTPGVQFHINNLKNSGIIRHIGSTKTGHWEILK